MKLLDKYLSLLPTGSPMFYLRALNEFPSEPNKSCFVNQRVGERVGGCGVKWKLMMSVQLIVVLSTAQYIDV